MHFKLDYVINVLTIIFKWLQISNTQNGPINKLIKKIAVVSYNILTFTALNATHCAKKSKEKV